MSIIEFGIPLPRGMGVTVKGETLKDARLDSISIHGSTVKWLPNIIICPDRQPISPKEELVFALGAVGLTSRGTAAALDRGYETVRTERKRINRKCDTAGPRHALLHSLVRAFGSGALGVTQPLPNPIMLDEPSKHLLRGLASSDYHLDISPPPNVDPESFKINPALEELYAQIGVTGKAPAVLYGIVAGIIIGQTSHPQPHE